MEDYDGNKEFVPVNNKARHFLWTYYTHDTAWRPAHKNGFWTTAQLEVCPSNGRLHWQGFTRSLYMVTRKAIQKGVGIPMAHVIYIPTVDQHKAKQYCKKTWTRYKPHTLYDDSAVVPIAPIVPDEPEVAVRVPLNLACVDNLGYIPDMAIDMYRRGVIGRHHLNTWGALIKAYPLRADYNWTESDLLALYTNGLDFQPTRYGMVQERSGNQRYM